MMNASSSKCNAKVVREREENEGNIRILLHFRSFDNKTFVHDVFQLHFHVLSTVVCPVYRFQRGGIGLHPRDDNGCRKATLSNEKKKGQ